jgi:membrane-bound lytic murein transglycosylase D
MSTQDLRGRYARVDRRLAARGWWLVPLLAAPLLPVLWSTAEVVPAGATAPGVDERVVGTELPLHVNDRVQVWLDVFQTTGRAEFARLLERSGIYEGMIRDKLRARSLPEDLIYLAMMESGLSPWAVSQVSAVGMWQFMGPTALQYGLRVDEYVDERRDPVRATDAALDYLEWLHARFDSWYLAAAAYNAGPGRVQRILRSHAGGRTGDEDLYWEVLDHLPRETREYVPRIVAATILANDAGGYGFAASSAAPYRFDRVFVPGGTYLARVAGALGVDPRVLRDLNPHLTRGITPPGEIYGVRVPVGGSRQVVASLAAGMGGPRDSADE